MVSAYYVIGVDEADAYDGNDFGFVCLKRLAGAYSEGFWSRSLHNGRTGQRQARVSLGDVYEVNGKLGTSLEKPKELSDYLTSPACGIRLRL